MSKKTVGWGLLVLVFLGYMGAQETQDQTKTINWIMEYPEAVELAKKENKPLLVFFHAPWSQPSQMMLNNVWVQPEIVAAAEKFVCVSINVDSYHSEMGFSVRTFPTMIISDPSAKEIFRRSGFMNAKDLFSMMKSFPVNFAVFKELQQNIELNAKDIESLRKLAEMYSKMRVYDMSSEYYKEALKLDDLHLDEELKDLVVFSLAMNQIRLRQYEEAEKALEEELKEYPKDKSTEKILYGIFIAKIGLKKLDEAEKTLRKLKSKYPGTNMTKQAEKILEMMKKQKNMAITVKKK